MITPEATIILCLDTKNSSSSLLLFAGYEAKKLGCALKILTIIEPCHRNLIFGAKAIGTQKRQEIEQNIKNLSQIIIDKIALAPSISIREGQILNEIVKEIEENKNCKMLILSKSKNSMSDNSLLPKLVANIGNKINVPVKIIPQNIDENFLTF